MEKIVTGSITRNTMANQELGLRDIKGEDIFSGLSPGDIVSIMSAGKPQKYHEESYIYRAEERQEGLYFLKTGQVEEFRLTNDGRILLLSRIGPGQFFGVATSRLGMYCCFAQATAESEMIFFSFGQLERICNDYPLVAINLVKWIARRLGDVEERFQAISFSHLRARVAQSLLELSRSQGSAHIDVTQETLSTWLPASRSRVSLILQELQHIGSIRLTRRRVEILDMKLLSELAWEVV